MSIGTLYLIVAIIAFALASVAFFINRENGRVMHGNRDYGRDRRDQWRPRHT